ncbi:MAG: LysM peptidoglycan-binding domain-containing protein [Anaerolineae bacterium]
MTLGRISARFNTTTRAIMEANGLTDPNLIFAGMISENPG